MMRMINPEKILSHAVVILYTSPLVSESDPIKFEVMHRLLICVIELPAPNKMAIT